MADQARKFNFTRAMIDAMELPLKRTRFSDTKVRGLTLMVWPTGGKVFYFYRKVTGRPVEVKLGAFADLSIEQARSKAQELNVAAANGQDPAAVANRPRGEATFATMFEWYMEFHSRKRKITSDEDEKTYRRYLEDLGKRPPSRIARTDLRQLHHRIGEDHGPYAANRMLALVRSVFNKAIAHDQFEGANPAIGVEMHAEASRERRLMPGEIPTFLRALEDEINEDIRDYVYLSLFTGARQANVLAMRWDEVDLASRTWRITKTKNGQPQVIPLQAPELNILAVRRKVHKGPWVFPGRENRSSGGHMVNPMRGWKRILDRAGLKDLRLHDLRRTLGSWMADTGSAENIIGKTLGHKSPAATAIYARLSLDPVRAAKDKAIDALLLAGEGS